MKQGPYEMYTPAELAFQKRYAFAQLIRNGITTALPIASLFYRVWGETRDEFLSAANAAGELGLRVYLGPAYRSGHTYVDGEGKIRCHYDEARGMAGLAEAVAFCDEIEGRHDGRACCAHRPLPRASATSRSGCIAASRAWNTTWCWSSTA
ncbi:hypothetical protein G6F65_022037 [Rhizopus arrhizus]|nr:hypothetical protein G6F65_022037 [Rhizopus arrhizus]